MSKISQLILISVISAVLFVTWQSAGKIRIFLIGDSTMANKPIINNPERGWGQVFHYFFNDNVIIENYAKNGRSTKSFLKEGLWQNVYNKLQPNDYVFIQFGHNDAKVSDTNRYAEAHSAYKENLLRYLRETREKGAFPILLTPVNRRKFDEAGNFIDQHGDYPTVVREVAEQENVPLIDLHKKSMALFKKLGPEGTKKLFLWIEPGIYEALPEGKEDNTHFVKYGALAIAQLVSEGLKEINHPLAKFMVDLDSNSLIGLNKIVALDYFFNCEWKKVDTGKIQYHYIWEDTLDSGFSQLGNIIDELGASIVSLRQSPTLSVLSRYSIYIIVDPDTPEETENPNYISDEAISDIIAWVKGGGVLVLMGNDKGKAEFDHLNRLAEKFGIHFNEDSHHRVVGNNYEMGKNDNLPQHPIFKDVKQIFMKEVSSLQIRKPAEPVLTEGELVLMATSKLGEGLVFVVGDPWLYNEYMDTRRLPPDYENKKAAKNLFQWLLSYAKLPVKK